MQKQIFIPFWHVQFQNESYIVSFCVSKYFCKLEYPDMPCIDLIHTVKQRYIWYMFLDLLCEISLILSTVQFKKCAFKFGKYSQSINHLFCWLVIWAFQLIRKHSNWPRYMILRVKMASCGRGYALQVRWVFCSYFAKRFSACIHCQIF